MFTVVRVFFDLECEGSVGEELLCCEDMIESIVCKTFDGKSREMECMDAIIVKATEVNHNDVDNEEVIKDDLLLIYDKCDDIVDCDAIKIDHELYNTVVIDDKVNMKCFETGQKRVCELKEIESMLSDEAVSVKMYRNRKL